MKTETLQALLADRELGELEPETGELLDALLAADPSARREAEAMARTLETVRASFRAQPGIAAPQPGETAAAIRREAPSAWRPALARAAAALALLGAGAAMGYRAGMAEPAVGGPALAAAPTAAAVRHEGLWTRYRPACDGSRFTAAMCP